MRIEDIEYEADGVRVRMIGKPVPRHEIMERLGPLMGDPPRIRAIGRVGPV